MFAYAGLVNFINDRQSFLIESIPFQLDASMLALTEVRYSVLDKLEGGQGWWRE